MEFNYWIRYGTHGKTIEQLINFCKKFNKIYVYGIQDEQRYMAKYLKQAEMPVAGFMVSWEEKANEVGRLDNLPVIWPGNFPRDDKAGIVIAVHEQHYNDIIPLLLTYDIRDFFTVEALNRFAVAQKMRPADRKFFWFEINTVEHCNLNCQMCDHFSPIAKPGFISVESFERQISRMGELMGGVCRVVKLEGGEPLMHPQIDELLCIARRYFPRGEIYLYTNGMLMNKWEKHERGNLWELCRNLGVRLAVTEYPIKMNYDRLREKAHYHGVTYLDVTSRNRQGLKYSFHHPFDLSGNVEPWQFINCYCFNNCITLRNGRIYPCSLLPNSHHFNENFGTNLKESPEDSLDIFTASSFEEIAEFVTKRPSFCRYCNVKERKEYPWKQSTCDIDEWTSRCNRDGE